MKLYCYCIQPIDFWFGAMTDKQLLDTEWMSYHWGNLAGICKHLADLEERAKAAFKLIGWEGDVREGPYYFALPGETEMTLGYIIKQDNDGTTFVASPEPLPSLDKLAS